MEKFDNDGEKMSVITWEDQNEEDKDGYLLMDYGLRKKPLRHKKNERK